MGEFIRRVRYLLRWRQHDDDLAAELDFHRRMKEAELEERGLDASDAAAAARKALGNNLGSREQARDVWIASWLQDIALDVHFAIRLLVRDRGFAATAILVLGLGIGVNNMMFTIIYAHTMRGLPIGRSDRVLSILTVDDRGTERGLSYPELEDLRAQVRSFAGVGADVSMPVTLGDNGRVPDRFAAAYVSAGAFATIGVQPIAGRAFTDEDDRQGASPVVILGSGAWTSRYASDATVLGRAVLVNGSPATVIGILLDRSGFPNTAQVWLPLAAMPGIATQRRDARTVRVFGRLNDTATETDARAEVGSIVDRMAREHPDTSRGIRARVVPIEARLFGSPTDPAWMAFMAAGILIMLISCANAANLMLARAADRTREIAVRSSLGASRLRVVHQLLVESAVLALLAGAAGVLISIAAVRVFTSVIPVNAIPYWFDYSMDGRVFTALAAVSFGAVFLFGLVPALQASRTDVNAVLKVDGRTSTRGHRGTRRWMVAFMTAELGLSVILLAHVVVDVVANRVQLASDIAIASPDLVTAALSLPAEKYRTREERSTFYRQLLERLSAVPGVTALTIAGSLPVRGGVEQSLEVEGQIRGSGEKPPSVLSVAIGPRYFHTLGLPLERGRELTDRDGGAAEDAAVVNQRFARLYFGDGDPIGRRIRLSPLTANAPSGAARLTVVGVAPDVRQRPGGSADPVVYTPLASAAPASAALLVRAAGDRGAVIAGLREQALTLDPNLPLYRTLTLPEIVKEVEWNRVASSRLVGTLTIIALTLSLVGLYAVTAHAVGQRKQEIGVRIALGARPNQVRALILKGAAVQVALGLVVGIAGTTAWDAAFLIGRGDVRFASLGVLIPVAALLAAVTVLACIVPVRRASRLDPVVALRRE